MGEFYFPCKYTRVIRALKKLGLNIKEGKKHTTAECIHNGRKTTVPRHKKKDIKSEVMDEIGNFLLDKFQKEKIKKYL